MDNLVVNDELSATVFNDQGSDTAATIVEGARNLGVETTLVNDGQTLLDITSLSHADDATVVSQIKDSVLLEDRTEHTLNDHRWLRVADKRRLFMELSGKEVNTKIPVLTSLTRLRDSNDLAWSALQDQEVSDSDEVAGNGDSVTRTSTSRLDVSDRFDHTISDSSRAAVFLDDHAVSVVVVVMMVEWVEDAVGSTLDASSEAVIFSLVVVVAHFVSGFFVDGNFSYGVFLNYNVVCSSWSDALVFNIVVGLNSATVIAFSDVNLSAVRWLLTDKLLVSLVVVASWTLGGGDVKVDLRSSLVIALVLLSRKIYLCKSLTLDLFAGVLTFRVLSGISARHTGFFNDTEVVGSFFAGGAFAVTDVDFFSAESSIFPSDALGGSPLGDFPFYLCLGGSFYGSSVTPVRRREDTDWDGDAGVEVQVANFAVVLSSRLS